MYANSFLQRVTIFRQYSTKTSTVDKYDYKCPTEDGTAPNIYEYIRRNKMCSYSKKKYEKCKKYMTFSNVLK